MSTLFFSILSFLLSTFSLSVVSERSEDNSIEYSTSGHDLLVVCYWGTWSNYRPGRGKFTPADIDPSLCTHIIYSFAGLDGNTSKIKSLDPWMDLETDNALAGFAKTTNLKYINPKLKVSIAIGGWNEGSEKYSLMARDPIKRQIFVSSVVDFIKMYSFDGLDLDWEYPANRGGIPEDKDNFIYLLQELRHEFDKYGYLLTAAIGAAQDKIDSAYDIPKLYEYLDYVHVMCYDYHGKWDRVTGHNAPLYSHPQDANHYLNVDFTLQYLIKKGASKKKTILGVPFYGRAFSLSNPHDHGLGSNSKMTSFKGPFTGEDGFMGYNEICSAVESAAAANEPWSSVWDEHIEAPYMYQDTKWISFDSEESLRKKVSYAINNDLGGVMVWSIDTDDFRGDCGSGIKFPLLKALNNALYRSAQGLPSSASSIRSFDIFSPLLLLSVISVLCYLSKYW